MFALESPAFAPGDLAHDMTHAAMTPLLGRSFDPFLFASIDEERDDPVLSVVSALARLDVDPWKEAASLARMPKDQAKERLTFLIASLPAGATTGSSPEIIAARLIALLPQAGSINTAAAATLRPVARIPVSQLVVAAGVLALVLVGYFLFTTRFSAPQDPHGVSAATSEPAGRR